MFNVSQLLMSLSQSIKTGVQKLTDDLFKKRPAHKVAGLYNQLCWVSCEQVCKRAGSSLTLTPRDRRPGTTILLGKERGTELRVMKLLRIPVL